jgi:hypothetical protein
MACLDLAPAITALGSRPEEFEFFRGGLTHLTSRHSFRFLGDDEVQIHALCDCALLRARPEQLKELRAAFRQWHAAGGPKIRRARSCSGAGILAGAW